MSNTPKTFEEWEWPALQGRVRQIIAQLREVRELVLPNDPRESHQQLMEELRGWERHADANLRNLARVSALEDRVRDLEHAIGVREEEVRALRLERDTLAEKMERAVAAVAHFTHRYNEDLATVKALRIIYNIATKALADPPDTGALVEICTAIEALDLVAPLPATTDVPTIKEMSGLLSDEQCRAISEARDDSDPADLPPATPKCQDCDEPSTRVTADGVPLCEGDYVELQRQSGDLPAAAAASRQPDTREDR